MFKRKKLYLVVGMSGNITYSSTIETTKKINNRKELEITKNNIIKFYGFESCIITNIVRLK